MNCARSLIGCSSCSCKLSVPRIIASWSFVQFPVVDNANEFNVTVLAEAPLPVPLSPEQSALVERAGGIGGRRLVLSVWAQQRANGAGFAGEGLPEAV